MKPVSNTSGRHVLLMAVLGFVSVVIALLICSHKSFQNPRSKTSHVIRWLNGEWGGKQIVDDLGNDLRKTAFIDQAQSWSVETMQRFNEGETKVIPYSAPWDPVVALSTNEIPEFIKLRWNKTPDYEICLTNGRAESILIDWYSHGIVIGTTNYNIKDSRWDGHYYVALQPGVFVVWYDPK